MFFNRRTKGLAREHHRNRKCHQAQLVWFLVLSFPATALLIGKSLSMFFNPRTQGLAREHHRNRKCHQAQLVWFYIGDVIYSIQFLVSKQTKKCFPNVSSKILSPLSTAFQLCRQCSKFRFKIKGVLYEIFETPRTRSTDEFSYLEITIKRKVPVSFFL